MSLQENYNLNLQDREGNIVVIIHIYGAKAIFYYFVINNTPNLINNK